MLLSVRRCRIAYCFSYSHDYDCGRLCAQLHAIPVLPSFNFFWAVFADTYQPGRVFIHKPNTNQGLHQAWVRACSLLCSGSPPSVLCVMCHVSCVCVSVSARRRVPCAVCRVPCAVCVCVCVPCVHSLVPSHVYPDPQKRSLRRRIRRPGRCCRRRRERPTAARCRARTCPAPRPPAPESGCWAAGSAAVSMLR